MKKRAWVGATMALMAVAVWADPSAAQGVIEVPLEVRGGRFVVEVTGPRGEALDFVVGTGNGVTVLAESVKSTLGDAPLSLAGVPLAMEGAAAVADEQLRAGALPVHGIVGSNTLNRFDVLVDAPGGRLVLRDVGSPGGWDGVSLGPPVRMRVYHGLMLSLDVELDGRAYAAALDLGAATNVVNAPVQAHLGVAEEDTGTLTVGPAHFPELPLTVQDLPILERWDPDGNGFVLVGAPFAVKCAVAISWVRSELRMCAR